jgi:uncharacterized protein with HEPN domain
MSPSARELLLHILDETSYLLSASDQLNQAEFLVDPTLKRAFTRSLEIIGEAVKSLPIALTDAQPQVDWRSIARMRDRLVHHYFGIDYEMVWGVVTTKVVPLDHAVRTCLEQLDDQMKG